ncbi:hypothetical protein BC936DRAFT_139537 [Jimgerdemannia flammicorona]|uniref:Uncharacterized protein n=1 Tax=Jimgerdemannia flammicorona TaxID=994334 RepID=A0A433B9P8_9FUNG|nr:hypothetical protein BC936DRAFT_139537 [Jimgerdemannia flammicorona]
MNHQHAHLPSIKRRRACASYSPSITPYPDANFWSFGHSFGTVMHGGKDLNVRCALSGHVIGSHYYTTNSNSDILKEPREGSGGLRPVAVIFISDT